MTLWHNPDIDKPNTDGDVLCVVSGRIKNVIYDEAYVLGAYCADGIEEGWVFETIVHADEEDYDNLEVHCWTELPKVPSGIKEVKKNDKE